MQDCWIPDKAWETGHDGCIIFRRVWEKHREDVHTEGNSEVDKKVEVSEMSDGLILLPITVAGSVLGVALGALTIWLTGRKGKQARRYGRDS